jgi:glutamate racemase
MSTKFLKENGKYYVIIDNKCHEITEFVEEEIKNRERVNHLLSDYFNNMSKEQTYELIEIKTKMNTLKKHLNEIITKSNKVVDDWAKTGNVHGSVISLRQQLAVTKRWADQINFN